MEKKRSVRVTVFSVIYILSGIMFLYATYGAIYMLIPTGYKIYLVSSICFPIAGLSLLVSGFLVFRLKSFGLILTPVGLLFTLPSDGFRYIAIALLIVHFYFFTRPGVKAQFSHAKPTSSD